MAKSVNKIGKRIKVDTKRMRLVALFADDIRLLISSGQAALDSALGLTPCGQEPDEELKTAYGEMLAGCEKDPKNYLWSTLWLMILKEENKCVGSLGFKGAPNDKFEVEIGYGTDEPYRKRGLCQEALIALRDWAVGSGAYYVQGQTEPDNAESQHILQKCGFLPAGQGEEGPMFEYEKPRSAWMSIFMMFGLSMGTLYGVLLDNIGIGLCFGIAIGMCIGVALDQDDKKHRKNKK